MGSEQMGRWHNWSGSVRSAPQQIVMPDSTGELAKLIGQYGRDGRQVRVVGAGHSFTPLAQTNDILMSLDNMQGIETIDVERGRVKVRGGTRLKILGDILLDQGLAQENLGDINVQSIAGAISTGTHGTGTRFGSLSTQVEGLTLVTASGEILECSAENNPDIFRAAQVSLGTLGVIASVTLRVVPAKRLRYQVRPERLEDCLQNLERYKQENSHFEFFWLPYTDRVQAKFLNETQEQPSGSNLRAMLWGNFNKIVLENGLYWVLSECCRLVPGFSRSVSKISAQAIATVDEIDYSHRVFSTPRWVRFQEMEYNLPAEHASAAIAEIRACIEQHRFAVHFPLECRFVRADDIWLSPAYQRDSVYLAVHMYRGMAYKPYFRHIEKIYERYQGRPHWGKMHTLNAERLAALYPRWQDFRRVQAALDPRGMFLNAYLRQLFDAGGQVPSEIIAGEHPDTREERHYMSQHSARDDV